MKINRRDLLAVSAAGLAGAAGCGPAGQPAGIRAGTGLHPRGRRQPAPAAMVAYFVAGDEDARRSSTEKLIDATGVEVRIDKESWKDIRPKAAVAANVGLRPRPHDVWFDDARRFPTNWSTSLSSPNISATNMAAGMTARRATPRAGTSSSPCRWRPSATHRLPRQLD